MKPEQEQYILENAGRKSAKAIAKDLGIKERKVKRFLEQQGNKNAQPSASKGISLRKRNIIVSVVVIILLGAAVYGNTLNGAFVWDDGSIIENNIYLTDWAYIPKIFSENIVAGSGRKSSFYRPVQMLTYMLDYSLWGLDVRGYHISNIIWHILAALSIYFLINNISGNNSLSLFAGALFVIHPVHTEAVAYISGRADPLALLFMMLCFLSYLKQMSSKSTMMYFFMVLSYTAALFSKENSLILPALLLVYHYSFKKKVMVKEFCSVSGLAVIYILLRVMVLEDSLSNTGMPVTTLSQRLPGFFTAMAQYVKLLFLPLGLHMEYGHQLFRWGDLNTILGAAICILLFIMAFQYRRKDELISFSITWFFIGLLPVSNLYPINAYMAEHWLYLPSIGFFLIAAKVINLAYEKKNLKMIAIAVSLGSSVFYSSLTVRQNAYWQDPVILFERTLKYAPESSKAYNNLGMAYVSAGRQEEAIGLYKKALEINPGNVEAYSNLGVVYASLGKTEDAEKLYQKAIERDPSYGEAYYNLGVVYTIMNKKEEAINVYKEAIRIHPGNVDAHFHLGVAYDGMNRKEEAIVLFKKTIELNSNYSDAYNNLGILYEKTGRRRDAVAVYKKALEINPDFEQAYYNLSSAYFHDRQYQRAVEYYDQARERGFVNPDLEHLLATHLK